mgnify:CR=1 FL=1
MMTTQIQITNTVMKTLTGMVKTSLEDAVRLLSEKYGFDRTEALEYLKVSEIEVVKAKKEKAPKKEKVVVPKKPAFLLPWCGSPVAGWCGAIRYNKGLYTQCTQKCKGGSQFCTTCLKHVSVDGIPQYGLVSERNNEGWTAPNGKSPVNYANVMDKLKNGDDVVTQEMAVAEAAKFNWTIPEEQFVKTKTRKGRPAKAKAEKTEKKTRGRPKKQKPITTGGAGDDLIAQLVAQAAVQNAQMEAVVEEEKDSQPSSPSTEEETTDQSEPTTPNQPTQAVKQDAPKKAKKPRKPKMTEEEKEAAKLAKQQEREAKKAAAKAEKEAAKAAAKAEKEAAKAKAKAEKEAAKAKAKAEKEAAKAKAAAKVETPVESPNTETDEKETTPEELAQNLAEMELKPESPADLEEDDESEEEEEEVKVETKTGADGKTYMVDAEGNVYDEEGYEIGTWDDESKAVIAA